MPVFLTKQDLMARWLVDERTVDRFVRRYRRTLLKPTKFTKRTIRWRLAVVEKFERWRDGAR